MTPKKIMNYLKELKADPSIVGNKVLSKNLLYKNLDKYIKITMSKAQEKSKGQIETFRNLIKFKKYVNEVVDILEKDLSEIGVEYFFPEDLEKVVTEEVTKQNKIIKKTSLKALEGGVDWKKAIRQRKNEA